MRIQRHDVAFVLDDRIEHVESGRMGTVIMPTNYRTSLHKSDHTIRHLRDMVQYAVRWDDGGIGWLSAGWLRKAD